MRKERVGYYLTAMLFLFGMAMLASVCYYELGFNILLYIAWGSIISAVIVGVLTERCPYCHKYLGVMFFDGKKEYCSYCGVKFADEWQKNK